MEYVYESIGLIVFLLITLAFLKPPEWLKRALKFLQVQLDKWI
jgi:hypothetical protein